MKDRRGKYDPLGAACKSSAQANCHIILGGVFPEGPLHRLMRSAAEELAEVYEAHKLIADIERKYGGTPKRKWWQR